MPPPHPEALAAIVQHQLQQQALLAQQAQAAGMAPEELQAALQVGVEGGGCRGATI